VNTAEERQVADAVWNLRHGYFLPALAVLEHLQEQSHLTHGKLIPMTREVQP
jgi:hypothetical protein